MKTNLIIKFVTAVLMFAGISVAAMAQTRTVNGTVVEKTSDGDLPMAGVFVKVQGQNIGTTTDAEGNYSLDVPEGTVLEFSFMGYDTAVETVGDRAKIDVVMSPAAVMLDDLVVIGYGVQKRSDVAGSVTSIKAEDIVSYPASNVAEMLRGKAAGVTVSMSSGAPGSGSSIQVRGTRSLLDGSNSPLYVIDGVSASSTEFNALNPDDVSNIEILKDAASQAIYGARAANGVILVTTKRGEEGKPTVTFNTTISSQHLWRNFDFYSPEEWYELRRQAVANDAGIDDPEIIAALTPADVLQDEMMEKAYAEGKSTDWESLMFSPAIMQRYNLGIRGGGQKFKIASSLGYLDQKGMSVVGSKYKRFNFRVNADYDVFKWLTIGVTSSLVKSSNLAASSGLNTHITRPPYGLAYDDDGNILQYINSSGDKNPLYDAQYEKEQTDANIIRLNGYIDIHPFKGFSYRLNAGYYNRFSENGAYKKKEFTSGGAAGSMSNSSAYKYTIENIFNYDIPFRNQNHSLVLTGVIGYEHETSSSLGFGADNVPVDEFWWHMIADGENTSQSHSFSEYYILSYLLRAQYNFKDRYIVNAAVRRDGSSRFGKNNKWGTFPSISAAWRISQEPWMKKATWVSNLKLRASIGMVGNQGGIGNYETLGTVTDYRYEFGDNYYTGYLPGNSLPNQSLQWESTTSANFGVDFGFFKNRLNGTIEYYNTTTNNLLFNREINSVLGYTRITDNVAKTRTTGWDISLDGYIINKKDLVWNIGVVYSVFDNKILRLSGEVDENGNPINDINNRWFIGSPINVLYDYKTDGIYQYEDFEGQNPDGTWILKNTVDTDGDGIADAPLQRDDVVEPGKVKIVDKNGDGKINGDDRYIIRTDPEFTASINMSFRYKGFDFFMDWYGVYGAVRRNSYLSESNNGGSLQGKLNGIKVNYWTPDNPSNEWPRPSFNSLTTYQNALAITDASYIRLRTLAIGYTLPKKALKALRMQNIRIGLTATNLLTFTKYLSYSPEATTGAYPEARQFAVSLNLTF